jgi:hypothetical protein
MSGLKDYIKNDIGLSLIKNNGKEKIFYPIKARKCQADRSNNFRKWKDNCIFYNEKNDSCEAGFKCKNATPKEKCYKILIYPSSGEDIIANVISSLLLPKIMDLRAIDINSGYWLENKN